MQKGPDRGVHLPLPSEPGRLRPCGRSRPFKADAKLELIDGNCTRGRLRGTIWLSLTPKSRAARASARVEPCLSVDSA